MNNILDFLEQTVKRMPSQIAIEECHHSITWKNFYEQARQNGTAIARLTSPKKPVAIIAEKSIKTLCAMIGTVYAGCFYVIIDPSQPLERLKTIFETLNPALVVHHSQVNIDAIKPYLCCKTASFESLSGVDIDEDLLTSIRTQCSSSDFLYGIFTSGSTGIPKCIVVSHDAASRFIKSFIGTVKVSEKDRLGNQAPFDFDISVKDIYTSLFTGASLVLIPKQFFSTPPVLLDYLCEKKVTVLIWAVSALTLVSALKGLDYRTPSNVRLVMFSGEIMPAKQLAKWQQALPEACFYNLYGPTEVTCNCSFYKINHPVSAEEKLPIGHAFPGRKIFLLDEAGHLIQTPQKSGEICVSGESLSSGYFNNLQETSKRFIENNSGRYYRTGDLGYFDEDGVLYFLGRKDFQIKHMGHRIELEEIENAIYRIDGIERCCCLMDEKHYHLVAFYMGNECHEHVRHRLKQVLPAYMVPHRLIQMEDLPLNKNGKTDRKALKNQLERIRR